MAKLSLRLFIDEEKNEVLLAEADRDFVDTLFSVLTLPVGTIVRMLRQRNKESQSVFVGCLNNLYRSVEDMSNENFRVEECKQMLLYPRSVKDDQCRKLKLNVNDTKPLKYFINNCCYSEYRNWYSNFNTSRCSCGNVMLREIYVNKGKPIPCGVGDSDDGVFVSGRASFIITKDMNVSRCSPGLLLKTLGGLGCADVSKLDEMRIDVGAKEVLTFIECLLSSDSPLTDAFLKKQSSHLMSKVHTAASPVLSGKPRVVVPGEVIIYLHVIMRKVDRKILYVECGDDFIDLLFTFLAVPFEYLLEVSTDESVTKCVSNFVRSCRELRCHEWTNRSTSLYKLPWFYPCLNPLLDVTTLPSPVIYRDGFKFYSYKLEGLVPVSHKSCVSGFVKKGLKFMVTDDLFCTPLDLRASLSYLKKNQIHLDDIEEQVISIGKIEAKRLLGTSLTASSALNTAFGKLVAKMPKEEV